MKWIQTVADTHHFHDQLVMKERKVYFRQLFLHVSDGSHGNFHIDVDLNMQARNIAYAKQTFTLCKVDPSLGYPWQKIEGDN